MSWRRWLGRSALTLCAGVGLLVLVVTATPLATLWAGALAGLWNDPKGEVLVVLGGSEMEHGLLGESSYWRAAYAVLIWRGGGFRHVVLSGGGQGTPVAESMRAYLLAHGVSEAAVRVETRSRSTRENALFVKELLGQMGLACSEKVVLLTSDYHMHRARRVFERAGCRVSPRPIPDARKRASDWRGRWPTFLSLAEETVKVGYYWAMGWM